MREYNVTVNNVLVLELPVLTVTLRRAFFVPYPWLPAEDDEDRKPGERGRETYFEGKALKGAHFEMARIENVQPGDPGTLRGELQPLYPGAGAGFTRVTLPAECDPGARISVDAQDTTDARTLVTHERTRKAGAPATVQFSRGRTEEGGVVLGTYRSEAPSKTLGEVAIPLFGLREGYYVLKIVPTVDERSEQQDQTAATRKTLKDGKAHAYRDVYVWLRFNDRLELKLGDVALCKVEGTVCTTVPLTDEEIIQTHANVTALFVDELPLDVKPDFMRMINPDPPSRPNIPPVTNDHDRPASPTAPPTRDVSAIVIHGTGGSVISGAIEGARNEAKDKNRNKLGYYVAAHYYVDRDGHVLKVAYDDTATNHAGPGFLNNRATGRYDGINSIAIGIENVNRAKIQVRGSPGGVPEEPFTRRQVNGLARLVTTLMGEHGITRNRVVCHGTVGVGTSHVPPETDTWLDDRRLTCPGYEMKWHLLQGHQIGWEVPEHPRELTDADYSGFFTLDLTQLPQSIRYHGTWAGEAWYLRDHDNDGHATYAGIAWNSDAVTKALAAAKLAVNFQGIIAELQNDLRQLGYFIPKARGDFAPALDGSLGFTAGLDKEHQPTWQALRHFYMQLFCVDRFEADAADAWNPQRRDSNDPDLSAARGLEPPRFFTRRAARYLKSIIDRLPAVTASNTP
jgi:N-acetyl-anhydromuramyl-L-alanine amidase AmpD